MSFFSRFRSNSKRDISRLAKAERHKPRRTLRHEHLEERRVLATLTVNTADDLALDSNDGFLTVREAIRAVNGDYVIPANTPASGEDADQVVGSIGTNDLIKFDPRVFGFPTAGNPNRTPVIELLHGELLITNSVTIDGAAPTEIDGNLVEGPGWEGLTIDALAA